MKPKVCTVSIHILLCVLRGTSVTMTIEDVIITIVLIVAIVLLRDVGCRLGWDPGAGSKSSWAWGHLRVLQIQTCSGLARTETLANSGC